MHPDDRVIVRRRDLFTEAIFIQFLQSALFNFFTSKLNRLNITVRSPGLPGQRFMMLEYRVPVSGISDAVDYPRTSASHMENCPTQRILSERVTSWLSKHARFSGGFCGKKRIISSFP